MLKSVFVFLVTCVSVFFFTPAYGFTGQSILKSFSAYPIKRLQASGIESRGILGTDNYLISIQKNALNQEFILKSNLIFLDRVQSFGGLKSRIVSFKLSGQKLYMMDVTGHNSVTHDIPQNIILTSFKITHQTDNEIFFDFNQGMSELFIASEWKGSDFEGITYVPDYVSVHASQSYLENVQINTEKNRLFIRQIAQISISFFGISENINTEVRYYLEPYVENVGFKKVKTADFRKFGFFEITPHLDPESMSTIYATKFDERKPIVFAVSANTPEEYRDAVKDGALYYNKILGAGKVQVIMAPHGVTAPHPDYNVIQWIHWDGAGFAYADAQADPRTGETLHGQVFFTSAFVAGSRAGVRRLLRSLDEETSHNNGRKKMLLALRGLEMQPMCDYKLHERQKNALIHLLSENATDAMILKASQDYIREVVAHEVGHVVGLRHNFAGSHGGSYPVHERETIFRSYLKNQKTPKDVVPTSSVMDYNDFYEAAMTGDIIADAGRQALTYDTKALQYLYQGMDFEVEDVPLFCTDSHLWFNDFDYEECMLFDAGSSRIAWAAYETEQYLNQLPNTLMEGFIRLKAPGTGRDPQPLENIRISSELLAAYAYDLRSFIVNSLTKRSKYLTVRRPFSRVNFLNEEEIEKQERSLVYAEILALGGLSKLLQEVPEDFGDKAFSKFVELTKKEEYRHGIGLAGQSYEFSEGEITLMKKIARLIFSQLEEALVKNEAQSLLPFKGPYVDHAMTEPMANLIQKRIERLLLSVKDGESNSYRASVKSKTDVEKTIWMNFELPVFKYSAASRSVVIGMLADTKSEARGWNWKALEELGKTVPSFYKQPLQGYDFFEFDHKKIPAGMSKWLNENSVFAAMFAPVILTPPTNIVTPIPLLPQGSLKKKRGTLY